MNNHVLIIDGQNFLYRAMAGWKPNGEVDIDGFAICFGFF